MQEIGARTAAATPGTFTPPILVNNNQTNDQADPVIASTPNNGLFAAWQDSRSGNWDIYTSRSNDNGTTWSANMRADDSVGSSMQINPSVAVSGSGTVLLVWQDNRRSTWDWDVYFAKSNDGGATFSRNVKADDSNATISWQERPSVTVTNTGTIYVGWTDDRTGILRVRGSYSSDGGLTFSPSEEIVSNSPAGGQDELTVVANGNRIFAAFMDNVTGTPHPYLSISTNNGKSFNAPCRLDGLGTSVVPQRGVTIAPMPGGGVVAAWEDSRNGNWDIYASIISFKGVIVSPDIRVDDDSSGVLQEAVVVAADPLGNIFASWTDQRNNLYEIRLAFLVAGSTVFNASYEVARPTGNDMQRSSCVVAPAPGRAFIIWQDDKVGFYDVYSSSVMFPELYGLFLASGWNFVSIPSDGYVYNASTLGLKTGDAVSRWNETLQKYDRTYLVGVSPPFMDFPLKPSTGYMIYAGVHERINLKGSVPTQKQTKHINVPQGGGWALLGFESLNTTRYASDVPGMLNSTGQMNLVARYDALSGRYVAYVRGVPFLDFVLVPGEAYWCYVTASGTLTYTP